MIVIVTCNVVPRFRGFLASCMLEIAPGVYTAPKMNKGVRNRLWNVLTKWFNYEPKGYIVMTWTDSSCPGNQALATLGLPSKEIVDYDGIFLVRKDIKVDETDL